DVKSFGFTEVTGSGKLASESRSVAAFTAIDIEGSADVVLTQDATQSVRVEADDNIVPIITTEVKNGKLTISTSKSVTTKNKMTVYISIPTVTALGIDG